MNKKEYITQIYNIKHKYAYLNMLFKSIKFEYIKSM